MGRRITALLLLTLAACGSSLVASGTAERRPRALSYAQYLSLERGLTLSEVEARFGPPQRQVRSGTRVAGVSYRCENALGEVTECRLLFDRAGRLQRWGLRVVNT